MDATAACFNLMSIKLKPFKRHGSNEVNQFSEDYSSSYFVTEAVFMVNGAHVCVLESVMSLVCCDVMGFFLLAIG